MKEDHCSMNLLSNVSLATWSFPYFDEKALAYILYILPHQLFSPGQRPIMPALWMGGDMDVVRQPACPDVLYNILGLLIIVFEAGGYFVPYII